MRFPACLVLVDSDTRPLLECREEVAFFRTPGFETSFRGLHEACGSQLLCACRGR